MPRIKQTTVYTFDELSDQAKEKARDWYREGQDNSWPWETTQEDASQIGLKIVQLDGRRVNEGSFVDGAIDCAKAITENHGPDCETYKTAKAFLLAMDSFAIEYPELGLGENEEGGEEECKELEKDFLQAILEDYRIIFEKDCEYQSSDEVVDENITANDYTFTADGKRFD